MKRLLFLLLVLSSLSSVVLAQQLPDSTVDQLKNAVQGFKERYHSPSIVVAVVHDRDLIFSEALGFTDVKNQVPATMESKYSLQSVGKLFTATMLMQLKQKKQLALEDDIKIYLPEFYSASNTSGKSGITLLQLATHTSGLPRNSGADIRFTKQVDQWLLARQPVKNLEPATKEELLRSLKYVRKEYPDYELLSYGDRHYSNLGYSMLGISLERAAKTDYIKYVINNICQPLGMTQSTFDLNKFLSSGTKGYYYDESSKEYLETPVFKANSAIYAGGLYSTASDLVKFISFQFDESRHADSILSKENRAMMYNFRIAWKPNYPWTFHEGANLGYRSEIVIHPDAKIGWVILTNTTDFDFSRINQFISERVMPVFNKKPSNDLNKYTGIYKLEGGYDSLQIYMKDEQLYSSYLKGVLPEKAITASGLHKFKGAERGNYNISYEFIVDKNDKVRFLNMGQLMWIRQ